MKKVFFSLLVLIGTALFTNAQPETYDTGIEQISQSDTLVSAASKADEVILDVAKGLGVDIDTSATAPEIAGQIIEAYKGVPVKGSPPSAWIIFVLSILGTIGTIYFYAKTKLLKSKLK